MNTRIYSSYDKNCVDAIEITPTHNTTSEKKR